MCPGSAALPQSRTSSEYAEQGRDNHDDMESAVHDGDYSRLPDEVQAALAEYDVIQAEVAVAFDVATGEARELGVGVKAYEGLAPFEIPGRMDLLALDAARTRALVLDWKLYSDADWTQLLFYALAIARCYRLDEVTVAFVYLGTGRVHWRTLDALDLDAFSIRLRDLHERVAKEQRKLTLNVLPDTNEGKWCRYCPASPSCPSRVALARRVLDGNEANAMALVRPLDDASAARLYHDIARARSILEQLSKAVYARAAESPIPLGGGTYLGKTTKYGNEKLDGDVVWQVVSDRFGRDLADLAVTRSATKKALHEALRDGKTERDVLDEVRRRGGARRDDKEDIAVYQASLPGGDGAA